MALASAAVAVATAVGLAGAAVAAVVAGAVAAANGEARAAALGAGLACEPPLLQAASSEPRPSRPITDKHVSRLMTHFPLCNPRPERAVPASLRKGARHRVCKQ